MSAGKNLGVSSRPWRLKNKTAKIAKERKGKAWRVFVPLMVEQYRVMKETMTENEIGKIVVDCALRVHKSLGAGLLESTYEACLSYELRERGLGIEPQKALPVVYQEVKLDCGYRIDLLIEKKVIVEIKSVEALNDVHLAQILTYLKLSGCKLGFLINFNVALLKSGIRRVVNNL